MCIWVNSSIDKWFQGHVKHFQDSTCMVLLVNGNMRFENKQVIWKYIVFRFDSWVVTLLSDFWGGELSGNRQFMGEVFPKSLVLKQDFDPGRKLLLLVEVRVVTEKNYKNISWKRNSWYILKAYYLTRAFQYYFL